MLLYRLFFVLVLSFSFNGFAAQISIKNGEAAPHFEFTDTKGETVNIENYKGKIVVLEWKNHQCPFVIKHYETGNMQKTQKYVTKNGGIWITIISSAPEKEGYVTGEQANKIAEEEGSYASHILLDPTGNLAEKYDAKTTPNVFIIDANGNLAYQGAIDDDSSPVHSTVLTAHNFVKDNFDKLRSNEAIEIYQTTPYGCSIKD